MKKQSIFYAITAMALSFYACSQESIIQESEEVKGVSITLTPFACDDSSTRTAYTVSETDGFLSSWTEGDIIGIYPVGGDQVAFPISNGAGTSTAKFDGGAWALRANFKYAAYYRPPIELDFINGTCFEARKADGKAAIRIGAVAYLLLILFL